MEKKIGISAIEYYLPKNIIDNDSFEYAKNDFLEHKVGIKERRWADKNEATSDLATKAINKLIEKHNIDKKEIEFLVLCTLSPDHPLPQTSSQLQTLCGFEENLYTIDIRMGCTGFPHSMSVAYSLIHALGYKKGIVVTADKFSMYLSGKDFTVDTIFSDAGAALLMEENPKLLEICSFDFGTRGSMEIIVEAGGSRLKQSAETSKFETIKPGIERSKDYLYMNGRQVMKFAYDVVPKSLGTVLEKENITTEDIDWLVMHQANKQMLLEISKRAGFTEEKTYINMLDKGNSVAASIPIALAEIFEKNKKINNGKYWLSSGFGVGLTWGTILMKYVGKDY